MSDDVSKPVLPVFYSRPVPLQAGRHAGWALATQADYGFARNVNALPLNAVEFVAAVPSYPIVFPSDERPMPMAVLGLRERQNLFVDAAGAWAPGEYVPAYVRRYPFIFFEQNEPEHQFTLGVDEDSGLLSKEGDGQPLFADGELTEVGRRALEFCTAYQREMTATRALIEALQEAELLIARTMNIRRADGSEQSVSGFHVIDGEKLDGVADETWLEWRRRGYLQPIYAQLASMGCWSRLVLREQTG